MKLRLLLAFFLFSSAAFAQFSIGVKAGVPVTDFFETGTVPTAGYFTDTHHWTVGPTIEIRLPASLAIEVDALYQRVGYHAIPLILGGPAVQLLTASTATANSWEFPLLIKYRAGKHFVRPFLDTGVAFHSISDFKQIGNIISPSQLVNDFNGGWVIGGGLDAHILLHIEPELRYTRWFNSTFIDPSGGTGLQANRNQVEFLVGFRF